MRRTTPSPTTDPAITAIIDQVDALFHDAGFQTVVDWKRDHPGGKVIGCLPIYVPREIIHAAGMLPVTLRGAGDQVEIIRGDAYFQSYICQLPRGMVELALSGRLDVMDGFIFPAICDVIRNLSGMWQMMLPGKFARYLDVPQNFDAEVGGRFCREELDRLRTDLADLGGQPTPKTCAPTSNATSG